MKYRQAIESRLSKSKNRNQTNPLDPRGLLGILGRGSNIYRGGLPNAQQGGGPQFGRPTSTLGQVIQGMVPGQNSYAEAIRNAISRRLGV